MRDHSKLTWKIFSSVRFSALYIVFSHGSQHCPAIKEPHTLGRPDSREAKLCSPLERRVRMSSVPLVL